MSCWLQHVEATEARMQLSDLTSALCSSCSIDQYLVGANSMAMSTALPSWLLQATKKADSLHSTSAGPWMAALAQSTSLTHLHNAAVSNQMDIAKANRHKNRQMSMFCSAWLDAANFETGPCCGIWHDSHDSLHMPLCVNR